MNQRTTLSFPLASQNPDFDWLLYVFFRLGQQCVPDGAGNANGRICTGNDTNHHRQCEFLNGRHTKEINGTNGKQCWQGCIDGTRQCLADALIDAFCCLVSLECPFIFTNTVENNNGRVYGIPQNRQEYRNKSIIYGNTEIMLLLRYSWRAGGSGGVCDFPYSRK